jgi:hypothetical protein
MPLLAPWLQRFGRPLGPAARHWPESRKKRLVFLFRREGRVHFGERLRGRRTPHCMRGHVARHYCSGANDGASTDPDVAEDHAMRSYVNLVLDLDRRGVLGRPFGSPVEVREDRGSHADRAVIADRDRIGMHVVDVDLLPNPNSGANSDAPKPMECWPDAAAARSHVGDLLQKSLDKTRQEHGPTNDTPSVPETSVPLRL